jgi:DNA-binding SARP family transcriptional activator
VAPNQSIGTYAPPAVVRGALERRFMQLSGRTTEGAAYQAILRARRDFGYAVRSAAEAAPHRMPWLLHEVRRFASQRPVPALRDALRAKAHADAPEDVTLQLVTADPTNRELAERLYRQCGEEGRKNDDLMAALNAAWGFDVGR